MSERRRGFIRQIPIYIMKFFRMFIYMDEWKTIPMAGLIAALVSFAIGKDMFVNMEGTLKGSLSLSCVCIWNGFFNSIQSVCRERQIIKREHRAGMKLSSYIAAQMVYQAFLCLSQACITLLVCYVSGMRISGSGIVTPFFYTDLALTFFFITYASDATSLFISSLAKNPTFAMTVMPFVLIFELLFSGGVFALEGFSSTLSHLTIAKYGLCAICAIGGYNSLPMTSIWKQVVKLKDMEYDGMMPIQFFVEEIERQGKVEEFCLKTAESNINPAYESTFSNVAGCWAVLIVFAVVFALLSILVLSRIDNDRR